VLVSDSGGVQEEVTVLGRPLVVVRRSTERPEAFENHAVLVGPGEIATAAAGYLADLPTVHRKLAGLGSPYGDGTASTRIVAAIRARYGALHA
jgi:UDP-N-acetylglucosamine 2-epimerase (non-hydrolysing)